MEESNHRAYRKGQGVAVSRESIRLQLAMPPRNMHGPALKASLDPALPRHSMSFHHHKSLHTSPMIYSQPRKYDVVNASLWPVAHLPVAYLPDQFASYQTLIYLTCRERP